METQSDDISTRNGENQIGKKNAEHKETETETDRRRRKLTHKYTSRQTEKSKEILKLEIYENRQIDRQSQS